MPVKKSEKIKLYFVIGLLCVAVIVAYFRFVGKKNDSITEISKSPPQEMTFNVSQMEKPRLRQRLQEPRLPDDGSLKMNIRDIFSPLRLPIETDNLIQSEQTPEPSGVLTLKGTIIGGKDPMAVINDKFVRLGEKIGEYQVVTIYQDGVLLKSGGHEIVLHILRLEEK